MSARSLVRSRSARPKLWGEDDQRRYRRQLITAWLNTLEAQLLPQLLALPMPVRRVGGGLGSSLVKALTPGAQLRIVSPWATGRSLALRQVALYWAQEQVSLGSQVPLMLHLPDLPADPNVALNVVLQHAGLPSAPQAVIAELNAGRFCLLLDGWDELAPAAQLQWQTWICALAGRFPALTLCVVTGPTPNGWGSLAAWELVSPDAGLLATWLAQLLPATTDRDMVDTLLQAPAYDRFRERLLEVALVAATCGVNGLPTNRSDLQRWAVGTILTERLGAAASDVCTQLAALAWERLTTGVEPLAPHGLLTLQHTLQGLITITAAGTLCFDHRAIWLAFAAEALATGQAPGPLPLKHPLWPDVLALAVGLVDDPTPLYARYRDSGPPPVELVLNLGPALREQRLLTPGWTEKILDGLAWLATTSHPQAAQAETVLLGLQDVLKAALDRALAAGADEQRWALKLLQRLPVALAAPEFLHILRMTQLGATERRAAASTLAAYPADALVPLLARTELPPDPLGQLLMTSLLALSNPAGRQVLVQRFVREHTLFPPAHTAADRLLQTRAALAILGDEAIHPAVQVLAKNVLGANLDEQTIEAVFQAAQSEQLSLRMAARDAVLQAPPALALRVLAALILRPGVPWEAQRQALHDLQTLPDPLVGLVLERAVSSAALPLAGRYSAATALRHAGPIGRRYLLRTVANDELPVSLRAALVEFLAHGGEQAALPVLLSLVYSSVESPLRAAAAGALGVLGGAEALAVLVGLLGEPVDDLEMMLKVITALGQRQDEAAIWALQRCLTVRYEEQMRERWRAVLPGKSGEQAPEHWPSADLPPSFQWRLMQALSAGETAADRPSSLRELVTAEVLLIRRAAIRALVMIGGPVAGQTLHAALREANLRDIDGVLADGLATLGCVTELVETLSSNPRPGARWAAIAALSGLSGGPTILRHVLAQPDVDAMTAGPLIDALVLAGDTAAVPVLEALALDTRHTPALRAQTVAAIGQLGGATAEGFLLALTQDQELPVEVRAAAAGACPSTSRSITNALRTKLVEGNDEPAVLAAALATVGRTGDAEVLPLLLRYLPSDDAPLAIAAITALANYPPDTIVPVLVRVAQNVHTLPPVRLHAMNSLMRLGSVEHRRMLRYHVERGPLPIQLLALDLLLSDEPTDDYAPLAQLLAGHYALPLRVRVTRALIAGGQSDDAAPLLDLLTNPFEAIQLRCLAGEALAYGAVAPALPALLDLAHSSQTPPELRRRVIVGLQSFEQPEAFLALSELALDAAPAVRGWALQALQGRWRGDPYVA